MEHLNSKNCYEGQRDEHVQIPGDIPLYEWNSGSSSTVSIGASISYPPCPCKNFKRPLQIFRSPLVGLLDCTFPPISVLSSSSPPSLHIATTRFCNEVSPTPSRKPEGATIEEGTVQQIKNPVSSQPLYFVVDNSYGTEWKDYP
ncbi:hypothetical protein AVEN_131764-1 [Araneus ventricosus]|uniref:Uncharacterized protein n=1 Tax=Araneus ventricosus TaxID=182803 RepID=A0A4Y2KXQ1_ARAVE|nr:hypothetical protein AVEN_131764-1 [Araneus ventricosus]